MAKKETITATQTKTLTQSTPKGATRYEEGEWETFEELAGSRGTRPTTLIQKFVRDYMNDSAISLDMLKPEMVNELKREASAKGVTVAVVVTNILAEWGITRLKERSKRA